MEECKVPPEGRAPKRRPPIAYVTNGDNPKNYADVVIKAMVADHNLKTQEVQHIEHCLLHGLAVYLQTHGIEASVVFDWHTSFRGGDSQPGWYDTAQAIRRRVHA